MKLTGDVRRYTTSAPELRRALASDSSSLSEAFLPIRLLRTMSSPAASASFVTLCCVSFSAGVLFSTMAIFVLCSLLTM